MSSDSAPAKKEGADKSDKDIRLVKMDMAVNVVEDEDIVLDDDIDDKERFIMDRIFCGFLPEQKLMDLKKTLVKELREVIEETPEQRGCSIASCLEGKSEELIKSIAKVCENEPIEDLVPVKGMVVIESLDEKETTSPTHEVEDENLELSSKNWDTNAAIEVIDCDVTSVCSPSETANRQQMGNW